MRISDWSSDVCSSDLLLDEELHYGDGARRRQLPVRGEGEGVDRPAVGVPVDAQHPVDVVRNVGGDLLQRAGEAGELRTAVLLDRRRAAGEEDLGLEHEAVADDADGLAAADELQQAAAELRDVPRQPLHLSGDGKSGG